MDQISDQTDTLRAIRRQLREALAQVESLLGAAAPAPGPAPDPAPEPFAYLDPIPLPKGTPQIVFCSECRAGMRFMKSALTLKKNPINAIPDPKGDIILEADGFYHILTADERAAPLDPAHPRYKSHFATCPQAHKFGRRAQP